MSHQDSESSSSVLGRTARNKIKEITGLQVQLLMRKLDAIVPILFSRDDKPLLSMQELIHDDDYAKDFYTDGEYNPTSSTGKHVLQEVSILGHLRRINAILQDEEQEGLVVEDDEEEDEVPQQQEQQEQEHVTSSPSATEAAAATSTPPSAAPAAAPAASSSRSKDCCSSNTQRIRSPYRVPVVAIELGAGTGKLSDRLQRSTNSTMNHILIDRQNFQSMKCRVRHMIARYHNKIHGRGEGVNSDSGGCCCNVGCDTGSSKDDAVVQQRRQNQKSTQHQQQQIQSSRKRARATTTTRRKPCREEEEEAAAEQATMNSPSSSPPPPLVVSGSSPGTLSSNKKNGDDDKGSIDEERYHNTKPSPIIQRVVVDIAALKLEDYITLSFFDKQQMIKKKKNQESSCNGDVTGDEDDNDRGGTAGNDDDDDVEQQHLSADCHDDDPKTKKPGMASSPSSRPPQKQKQQHRRCILLSKHLCGPACDLSISAINRISEESLYPDHIVVATCCHYLCTWDSFSGRKFWTMIGLTKEDFEVAVTVSQWASLKKIENMKVVNRKKNHNGPDGQLQPLLQKRGNHDHRMLSTESHRLPSDIKDMTSTSIATMGSRDPKTEANSIPLATPTTTTTAIPTAEGQATTMTWATPFPNLMNLAREASKMLALVESSMGQSSLLIPSEEFERAFSRDSKIALGVQVKQILDLARIAALQETTDLRQGYDVELVRYTTRSIEDRLLVAYKKAKKNDTN